MSPLPLPETSERAFINSGLSVYSYALSAGTTMAAAAPSATPAQSKTLSCPATAAISQIASALISRRNCARGFLAPLKWFFSAIFATTIRSSPSSTPYFLAYAGRTRLYIAAAVKVRLVPAVGIGKALRP